ncbi:Smr/MutS family protein [Altererythrobacter sp. MF3-039]|uniref:Smr/MutS family protein n=1 Tax=Altererythrobacter sp. MF3-039 TaxID=3252901 RepID=UPI00390C8C22
MSTPRGLSAEEAAIWAKVASTVTPMEGKRAPVIQKAVPAVSPRKQKPVVAPEVTKPFPSKPQSATTQGGGLDSHWDRKLKAGSIEPDFTLDLHGASLDGAYNRLMDGLRQANAMGARVVLLVTGKPRPVDPADRGHKRGAIRAKILDWLAASEFSSDIAAVRRSHRRHGGDGALYLVLKRGR